MRAIYKIENLKQEYINKSILDIKSLEIYQNEIVGIIGSNGSGKSTLLRHLAFLEEPKNGKICYKNITNPPLHIKREISILLPEPYLLKRSVKENLLFGLKIRNHKEKTDEKIEEVMHLVGLLPGKFLHRQWFELSSGETQRVALASRLILKPEVLLLDEPTNSLDFSGVPLFTNALQYANKNWGTTLVIATHDLAWLSSLATRKVGIHFGKLLEFEATNILLGKWQQNESELFFSFSDSQKLCTSNTKDIDPKKGVAIDPKDIEISTSQDNFHDKNILKAKIKSITCIEKSEDICIKVAIGTHSLEVIQTLNEFNKNHFFPTQEVFLHIKEKCIKNI